jgi:hypothetical protein
MHDVIGARKIMLPAVLFATVLASTALARTMLCTTRKPVPGMMG